MALDSDVPQADSQLMVEFYPYRALNTKRWANPDAAVLEKSREGATFIRIVTPGDKENIIERPVRESDKEKFPRQWLNFMRETAGEDIPGTRLAQWHKESPDDLSAGQLETLEMLKFQVVEQVAGMSDTQIMRVGMGADGLRVRAQAYLKSKNVAASSTEVDALKAQIDELKKMITERPQAPVVERKSRGWPKGKPRNPVNVNNDNAATHAAGNE